MHNQAPWNFLKAFLYCCWRVAGWLLAIIIVIGVGKSVNEREWKVSPPSADQCHALHLTEATSIYTAPEALVSWPSKLTTVFMWEEADILFKKKKLATSSYVFTSPTTQVVKQTGAICCAFSLDCQFTVLLPNPALWFLHHHLADVLPSWLMIWCYDGLKSLISPVGFVLMMFLCSVTHFLVEASFSLSSLPWINSEVTIIVRWQCGILPKLLW